MCSTVNTCTCMFKNILNYDYLHSLAASISQTTRSLAYTNGSFEKFGFKLEFFLVWLDTPCRQEKPYTPVQYLSKCITFKM